MPSVELMGWSDDADVAHPEVKKLGSWKSLEKWSSFMNAEGTRIFVDLVQVPEQSSRVFWGCAGMTPGDGSKQNMI
jgi:hypothetical protein